MRAFSKNDLFVFVIGSFFAFILTFGVLVFAQVVDPKIIPQQSLYPISATSTMPIAQQEQVLYESKKMDQLIAAQNRTNILLTAIYEKI